GRGGPGGRGGAGFAPTRGWRRAPIGPCGDGRRARRSRRRRRVHVGGVRRSRERRRGASSLTSSGTHLARAREGAALRLVTPPTLSAPAAIRGNRGVPPGNPLQH